MYVCMYVCMYEGGWLERKVAGWICNGCLGWLVGLFVCLFVLAEAILCTSHS